MKSPIPNTLKPKLYLLLIVSLLAVIKNSWPQATKPGAKDDNIVFWLPSETKNKHPNEKWTDFWAQRVKKPPTIYAYQEE